RTRANARSLRQNMTDAEQLVWRELRAHRFNGVSFRRQTPIEPYIADFVCHAAKLVIELDGGQHYEDSGRIRDERRDAFLASRRLRLLPFNNHDVLTNKDGVLETIAEYLAVPPP